MPCRRIKCINHRTHTFIYAHTNELPRPPPHAYRRSRTFAFVHFHCGNNNASLMSFPRSETYSKRCFSYTPSPLRLEGFGATPLSKNPLKPTTHTPKVPHTLTYVPHTLFFTSFLSHLTPFRTHYQL